MRIASLALVLLLAAPARADVCTWVSPGFARWNVPSNWSCQTGGTVVPGPTDTVIHTNGTTIDLFDVSPTVAQLQLGGASGIDTSTKSLTVTASLAVTDTPSTSGSGVLRLAAGGTGSISGVFAIAGNSRFINEGALSWPSGRITISNVFADGFTNLGTMTVSTDASSGGSSMGGGSVFVNGPGATLTRTGPGDTRLAVYFRNEGTVAVTGGQLSLSQGVAREMTDTGTYTLASGTTLSFGTSDRRTIAAGASITGPGQVLIPSSAAQITVQGTLDVPVVDLINTSTLLLDSPTTIPALTIAGGTLGGSGQVTVPGTFVWAGGVLSGSGTLTVPVGATLTMGTNSMQLRGTRRLVLEGTGTWTDRPVTGDATATFINRGAFAVSTDAVSGGFSWNGARVENAEGATFTRSGSGQTRMGGVFDNAGTVAVTAGEFWLLGSGTHTGRFAVALGTVLELTNAQTLAPGSVVEGTGRVRQVRQSGQLVHGGTVRPGGTGTVGTLLWTETSNNSPAPFAPTADAVLDVELANGPSDQLAVTANANLGGTLRVRLANGFVPSPGDRFPIVTCTGSCAGTFAALDLPDGLAGTVEVSAHAAEFVVGTGGEVCNWISSNGFSWHTPTHWSCGHVPTALDDVTLSVFNNVPAVSAAIEARTLTVTANTRITVPAGAALGDVRVLSGAVLSFITQPSTMGTLVVGSGGAIGGNGTVTVAQSFALGSGTIGDSGFGTLILDVGCESTVAAGPGETASIISHFVRNRGTLRWTARPWRIVLGGQLRNEAGALMVITAEDALFSPSGQGDGVLVNDGLLRKLGPGTATIGGQQGVGLFNRGRVEVAEGSLQLGSGIQGGSSTGRFDVAAGTTLRFSGNSTSPSRATLDVGSVVTGAGTVEFTGGQVALAGTFTPAVAVLNGGAIFAERSDEGLAPGTFRLDAGLLSRLATTGEGLFVVPGVFTWTGGILGAGVRLRTDGPATIDSRGGTGGVPGLSGTLHVLSTAEWTGGNILGGGVLHVAPEATFVARAELAGLASPSGQGLGVLLNEGTVRKTGAFITGIGGPQGFRIDNRGLFEVAEGTLQMDGTFGDPIPQTAGAFRLAGGSVTGPRRYELHGGVLDGSGSMAPAVAVGSVEGSPAALVPGGEGGIGTLSFSTLTLRSGAVVDVELAAAGALDQVAVAGNLALTGTLRVRLADGFVPAVGDRFPVVTCSGTCSGTFAALDLPDELTGVVEVSPGAAEFVVTAAVAGEGTPTAPVELALAAAPNPARGPVWLTVELPTPARIRLSVVDALGREVALALQDERPAGRHTVELATDALAPGVYVVRLVTSQGVRVRTLTIAR